MKKIHKKPLFWITSCGAVLAVTAAVLLILHLPKPSSSPAAGDDAVAINKDGEQVTSGTEPVDSVTVTGNKMTVHLTRITPFWGTTDIAHWFIAFPVDKTQIEHCTDFAVQTVTMREGLYKALYADGGEPKEYTPKTVFEGEVMDLQGEISICPSTELYPGDYIDHLSVPYTLADGTVVYNVKVGDTVRVTYDGNVSKGYPVTIKTVYSIEIIKGAEDE